MKMMHISFSIVLVLAGLGAATEPGTPDVAEVRQVMLDAAVKIEARFGAQQEEARGLGDRVRELLKQEPAAVKPVTTREKLAQEMDSMTVDVAFGGAVVNRRLRGYEFDNLPATLRLRARELEAAQPSVDILFRRWELADTLGTKVDAAGHRDALLHACREAVKARPDDVEAQAMLADALFATESGMQDAERAARTALEHDGGHLRARYVIASVNAMGLFNEVAGIDPLTHTTPEVYLNQVMKRRPSGPDVEKLASRAAQLCTSLDRLEAAAASDLAILLRCLALRKAVEHWLHQARISLDPAVRSADMLRAKTVMNQQPVFRDVATLRKALRLAADDGEAYAAILLTWANEAAIRGLLSPNKAAPGDKHQATATVVTRDSTTGRPVETETPGFVLSMPEEDRKMFEEASRHLKSMLASATGRQAALLHEALCRLDIHGLYGGRFQFGTRHVLDGLRHDPSCMNLVSYLFPICQGEFENEAMSAAVFEMQLALDPGKKRRQAVAAMLNSVGLHQRADALLDRCLRDAPEDFPLWNQKAVFMLKRDSSDDGMRKAEVIFDNIKQMPSFEAAAINDGNRLVFVKNYVLFKAMQGLWNEAVEIAESYLKEGFMPGEDARTLLQTLRELCAMK